MHLYYQTIIDKTCPRGILRYHLGHCTLHPALRCTPFYSLLCFAIYLLCPACALPCFLVHSSALLSAKFRPLFYPVLSVLLSAPSCYLICPSDLSCFPLCPVFPRSSLLLFRVQFCSPLHRCPPLDPAVSSVLIPICNNVCSDLLSASSALCSVLFYHALFECHDFHSILHSSLSASAASCLCLRVPSALLSALLRSRALHALCSVPV